MQILNINFPAGVNLTEQEVLIAMATRLYDTGKLTLQQAAELAKYDLAAFIEELMSQSMYENAATATHI